LDLAAVPSSTDVINYAIMRHARTTSSLTNTKQSAEIDWMTKHKIITS